jgi:subtilisin family serine protease
MNPPRLFAVTWRLAGAALCGLLAPRALAQAPEPIVIRDLGQLRTFLISEREALVLHRTGTTEGALRRRIEAGAPGTIVLNDTPSRALVRFGSAIDVAASRDRRDSFSAALPDVEVLPVAYAAGATANEDARRYLTRDVLVALPEDETLAQLAESVRAASTRSTVKDGFFILAFASPYHALDALRSLRARGVEAEPLVRRMMARRDVPIPLDQFFTRQWHLVNSGQDGGLPGVDANVLGAWRTTLGAGVTLSIVDDSVQTQHPDLVANCPPLVTNFHHDFIDDDNDPRPGSTSDNHGTACAGVAAASQNNGNPQVGTGALLGVSGAAPAVRLLGLRLISGPFTDEDSANALTWNPEGAVVDVSSNSWGPPDGVFGLAAPGILTREAFRKAAVEGRNGLGQVTVFAAGNGLGFTDDGNADGLANSRYVLAVSAVGHRGTQASYSEPGANILVAAPSQGDFDSIAIATTDVTGVNGYNPNNRNPSNAANLSNTDYTNTFNGTSSACPLAAGCVALVLSTNPLLGWRDVKEIIASTATRIQSSDPDWVVNGGGFKFNHKFGGGLVNASAAVVRARSWTNLGPEVKQTVSLRSGAGGAVPARIPDFSTTTPTQLTRTFDFSSFDNLRLEQIEVVIDATHPHRSDLEIVVTSPSGKRSVLSNLRAQPPVGALDTDVDVKDYTLDFATSRNTKGSQGWTFTSTHHWGENSNSATGPFFSSGKGIWTLTIRDLRTGSIGNLLGATINLYGTRAASGAPAPEGRIVFDQPSYLSNETDGVRALTVRRIGSTSGPATVDYVASSSTADADVDFTAISGQIEFTPGQVTAEIYVPILGDTVAERTETFYVSLKNPTGAALGGVSQTAVDIADDELNEVNVATLTVDDAEARETDEGIAINTGVFTIFRSIALPTPLTVRFALSGTAQMGTALDSDYNTIATTVTIPAFATSASVTITPRNDGEREGTETVILTLLADGAYTLGLASAATVNLRDNDLPKVELFAVDDFAREGTGAPNLDVARVRILRRDDGGQPLPTGVALPIQLNYGGTQVPPTQPLGNNYTVATADGVPVFNAVEIPAGSSSVDLIITPLNDDTYQATKTIVVGLEPNPDYDFDFGFQNSLSSASLHVIEDDPLPEATVPTVTIAAPRSRQRFIAPATITASGATADNVEVKRVEYRLNSGSWRIATFNRAKTGTWTADITNQVARGTNRLEVQAIDSVDNRSRIAVVSFDSVEFHDLTVAVNGDGTVSRGFLGATEREVGQTYTLTATPGAGAVFNGWTGLVTSTARTIQFAMPPTDATLTANFIASPFVTEIAGNYSGLVQGANFSHETSGYATLNVTSKGLFTGKLTLRGVTYSFKGEFAGPGTATVSIPRKNDVSITLGLLIDLNPAGTRRIQGTLNYGAFSATLVADRAVFSAAAPPPAALVKSYTLLFPPADPIGNAVDPRGYGVGTLKIDNAGIVSWSGTLADGTKVSQKQALTKDSTWPLFLNLYKGRGVMLGTVAVNFAVSDSDLNGTVDWFKPLISRDRYFASGFKIEDSDVIGSLYTAPPAGTRALAGFADAANNARTSLEEGSLFASIAHTATYSADNKVVITDPGADRLALSLNAATGTLGGSFIHSVTGRRTALTGVLFQKQRRGVGLFLGTTIVGASPQTGRLILSPAP